MPDRLYVRVVEVGPRDGLQNESAILPTADKVRLVERLADAGLPDVEVSSFVSPTRVPQLADAGEVFARLAPRPGVRYSALVPNDRGLDRALAADVRAIAVFTAASETFSRRNVGMTVGESLAVIERVVARARAERLWVRGYVSTAFVCPYEGPVAPARVAPVVQVLHEMAVDEVSIGDTVGRASPGDVTNLLDALADVLPIERVACHFHDTGGRALDNVRVALDRGVRVFDSAVAGVGGCPFAPGAPGNLATERLLAFLHAAGFRTGVDETAVARAGLFLRAALAGAGQGGPTPAR